MRFTRTLAAAAVAALAAAAAQAADYTLTLSAWGPPTHGMNDRQWPQFVKMIEEATDGRVTGEIKLNLAPPPAQMDLVQDGAVDVTILFHGYHPGRFVTTKLIELPGYIGSAEAASVAHWRVHQQYLAKADEHRGVKLIALHTHGPGQFYSVAKVDELSDIKDLKVRVPGGVANDVVAALGGSGIGAPATKVYEMLSSRAADAVVMPFESRAGFRLYEVAPYAYEMPGGFYRGSFSYIMNQESFDRLPDDIKRALEEKVFGEPLSRMLGRVWDEIDAEGRAATLAAPGNEIVEASVTDQATYEPIAQKIIDAVLAEIEALGIDAKAAHEAIEAEMAKEATN